MGFVHQTLLTSLPLLQSRQISSKNEDKKGPYLRLSGAACTGTQISIRRSLYALVADCAKSLTDAFLNLEQEHFVQSVRLPPRTSFTPRRCELLSCPQAHISVIDRQPPMTG
jgi:hypothetical protein